MDPELRALLAAKWRRAKAGGTQPSRNPKKRSRAVSNGEQEDEEALTKDESVHPQTKFRRSVAQQGSEGITTDTSPRRVSVKIDMQPGIFNECPTAPGAAPIEIDSEPENEVIPAPSSEMSDRKASEEGSVDEQDPMIVLSWNVDGLDEREPMGRTLAVIDSIRNLRPWIVMLQEVIDATQALFVKYLGGPYWVFEPAETSNWNPIKDHWIKDHKTRMPYYNLLLVSKHHFDVDYPKVSAEDKRSASKYSQMPARKGATFYFPSSSMGRHMLGASLTLRGRPKCKVWVCTSHLESLVQSAPERIRQLEYSFKWMTHAASTSGDEFLVLFGGDMNLRDSEVSMVENQCQAEDVWEAVGAPPASKFTWDTARNGNLGFRKGKPRLRFDRFYFKTSANSPLRPRSVQLTGLAVVDKSSLPLHPSDHFGVVMEFGSYST